MFNYFNLLYFSYIMHTQKNTSLNFIYFFNMKYYEMFNRKQRDVFQT